MNDISLKLEIGTLRTYEEIKAIPITKGHYASMAKDINESKAPEIQAIIGTIIELSDYFKILCINPIKLMQDLLMQRMEGIDITISQANNLQE